MTNRLNLEATYYFFNIPPVFSLISLLKLKKSIGDICNIWNLTEQEISNLKIIQKDKDKLLFKLQKADFEKLKETIVSLDCNILTYTDSNFPEKLKELRSPPIMIFSKGNIDLLNNKKIIGIVGTRKSSAYGEELVERHVKAIKLSNISVITGNALGIDSKVIESSIECGNKCISVLASGINSVTPAKSKDLLDKLLHNDGCYFSEFPPTTPAYKSNYPIRAKIIAALANDIIIIEAPEGSGALLVAKEAFRLKKNIYCPTSYYYDKNFSGSHKLIESGMATLTKNFDNIKQFM